MQRTKKIYLFLGLLLFSLTCCDAKKGIETEIGIGGNSYLNPEGDVLAILVGPRVKRGAWPALAGQLQIVLLELNGESSLDNYRHIKAQDKVFRDMAWNPTDANKLYFTTFNDVLDPREGELLVLDVSSENSVVTTIKQLDVYPAISTCFNWSPDGRVLAGLARKPPYRLVNSGELAVSYDGGRTCELTGIDMYGNAVWLNNKELYLMMDHDHTIVKVLYDGQGFKIKETLLAENYQISLVGCFNKKPVYVAFPRRDEKGRYLDKARRLFVGDQLVYEADVYLRVVVSTGKIAVEADKKVMIFDENLSVCHERRLAPKTRLLNFQPNTNIVFLVENWKTILCYDYTKEESPHVLFSVDMLNEPID